MTEIKLSLKSHQILIYCHGFLVDRVMVNVTSSKIKIRAMYRFLLLKIVN